MILMFIRNDKPLGRKKNQSSHRSIGRVPVTEKLAHRTQEIYQPTSLWMPRVRGNNPTQYQKTRLERENYAS